MSQQLTTIIPTLNEELHVQRSVSSAIPLGPVWVVDSGSTDATRDLAAEAGASVTTRAWLGHAGQKNWALDNLQIQTPWVLFLDADERLTPELQAEIRLCMQSEEFAAWQIPRRNIFMGRDLRHAWWYPDYQLRLFRFGHARYEERAVHEHMLCDGPVGSMRSAIIHESLKGTDEFLERHQRYAKAEALEILHRSSREHSGSYVSARRRLKVQVWYRMRHRPLVRFLWLYVVRRGFKDGHEGRIYCQLIGAYESMIDAYLLEARKSMSAGERTTPR